MCTSHLRSIKVAFSTNVMEYWAKIDKASLMCEQWFEMNLRDTNMCGKWQCLFYFYRIYIYSIYMWCLKLCGWLYVFKAFWKPIITIHLYISYSLSRLFLVFMLNDVIMKWKKYILMHYNECKLILWWDLKGATEVQHFFKVCRLK